MIFDKEKITKFREKNKEERMKRKNLREASKIVEKSAYEKQYRKSMIKESEKKGQQRAKEDLKKRSSSGFSGVVKSLQETGKRMNEMDRMREASKKTKKINNNAGSSLLGIQQEKNKMIKGLWDEDEW